MLLSCVGPRTWDSNPVNPHVPRVFKLYVNPTGKAALLSMKATPFPVGSIVVKEKYVAPPMKKGDWAPKPLPKNAKPELLTVMIKREKGFNPASGDWEYQVVSGDVSKVETKSVDYCVKCHATATKQDYIFKRHSGLPSGGYFTWQSAKAQSKTRSDRW